MVGMWIRGWGVSGPRAFLLPPPMLTSCQSSMAGRKWQRMCKLLGRLPGKHCRWVPPLCL